MIARRLLVPPTNPVEKGLRNFGLSGALFDLDEGIPEVVALAHDRNRGNWFGRSTAAIDVGSDGSRLVTKRHRLTSATWDPIPPLHRSGEGESG